MESLTELAAVLEYCRTNRRPPRLTPAERRVKERNEREPIPDPFAEFETK